MALQFSRPLGDLLRARRIFHHSIKPRGHSRRTSGDGVELYAKAGFRHPATETIVARLNAIVDKGGTRICRGARKAYVGNVTDLPLLVEAAGMELVKALRIKTNLETTLNPDTARAVPTYSRIFWAINRYPEQLAVVVLESGATIFAGGQKRESLYFPPWDTDLFGPDLVRDSEWSGVVPEIKPTTEDGHVIFLAGDTLDVGTGGVTYQLFAELTHYASALILHDWFRFQQSKSPHHDPVFESISYQQDGKTYFSRDAFIFLIAITSITASMDFSAGLGMENDSILLQTRDAVRSLLALENSQTVARKLGVLDNLQNQDDREFLAGLRILTNLMRRFEAEANRRTP